MRNLMFLGYLAAVLLAAAPAAAQSPATTASDAAPPLKALFSRLASDDFAQREAAQKELDGLDYHFLSALKEGLAQVNDAEAKARLQVRLDQLEEQCATNPPPISLKLTGASFDDLLAGLSQATGTQVTKGYGGGSKTFTLDVHEKPFWEVFRLLSAQDALVPGSMMGTFDISCDEHAVMKNFAVSGPFLVAPLRLSRTITQDFQNADPTPAAAKLELQVAVDPRTQVVRHEMPKLTSVVDEKDHSLLPPPERVVVHFLPSAGGAYEWQWSADLNIPADAGKKIALAKGTFRADVAVSTREMVLDDPADRLNKEFTFQNRKITITKWEPRDGNAGNIDFAYKVAPENDKDMDFSNAMEHPPQGVFFYEVDSTGRTVGQFVSISQGSSSLWLNGKAPIKLKIVVPIKTKQIEVPFEFKDLPLPGTGN